MKKKNLFAPPDDEDDDPTDDSSDNSSQDEEDTPARPVLASRFGQILNAAKNVQPGPATSRYSKFLDADNVPTRENTPPSKVGRLAAILGGASEGFQRGAGAGTETATKMLNEPLDRKIQSYGMQSKNLEKGAEIEDKDLGRQASFAKSTMQDIHNQEMENAHNADREAREAHWTEQDKTVATKAASSGFKNTIGADGHMYFIKPEADGTTTTLDGGKVGQSVPEKTRTAIDEYAAKEGIRGATQKDINTDLEGERQVSEGKRAAVQKELQDERLAHGDQPKTTKSTVTDNSGNVTGQRTTVTGPVDPNRDKAIETLKKNNKPITENNIKFVLDRMK